MSHIIGHLFNENAFQDAFCIGDSDASVSVPGSAHNFIQFRDWIQSLERSFSPEVLGLPFEADELLGMKQADQIIDQTRLFFLSLRNLSLVSWEDGAASQNLDSTAKAAPSITNSLSLVHTTALSVAQSILESVPNDLDLPSQSSQPDPLQGAIAREKSLGIDLVKM